MVDFTKKEDSNKKVKRERVPMHTNRQRLTANLKKSIEDQYKLRWFNDVNDRIQRATDGGYDFVYEHEMSGRVGDKEVHGDNSDLSNKVSKMVGLGKGVDPVRAYLMKIPLEFYEEDKAARAARHDEVDRALAAGTPGGASVDKSYGDIKVT